MLMLLSTLTVASAADVAGELAPLEPPLVPTWTPGDLAPDWTRRARAARNVGRVGTGLLVASGIIAGGVVLSGAVDFLSGNWSLGPPDREQPDVRGSVLIGSVIGIYVGTGMTVVSNLRTSHLLRQGGYDVSRGAGFTALGFAAVSLVPVFGLPALPFVWGFTALQRRNNRRWMDRLDLTVSPAPVGRAPGLVVSARI